LESNNRLAPAERNKLKAELEEHKNLAKNARDFYNSMPIKCKRNDWLHISMDSSESIQIPHFPQKPRNTFFISRVQLHLYGLIDDITGEKYAYFYLETVGGKTVNESCTFLSKWISKNCTKTNPKTVSIYLYVLTSSARYPN
jgi:hypothetical protein